LPRELVLGNGRLLINFDGRFNMRDLYFPHLGGPNHIAHLGGEKGKIGFWVDHKFSWLEEKDWKLNIGYKPGTLNGRVEAVNRELQIGLEAENAVHFNLNVYLKRLYIRNLARNSREIRVFFYHDFTLKESSLGDTGIYLPDRGVLLHYKRGLYFLINGRAGDRGFYQYAVGNKRFRGAEGTWRDAEDGRLEGNPVHHGSVDSTVSFSLNLASNEEGVIDYWLVAGTGWEEVKKLDELVLTKGLSSLLAENEAYWRSWASRNERDFADLPEKVVELYTRSLLVIRAHSDSQGAILAATDSDILYEARDHYGYCWPRDGAFTALALDQAGYREISIPFYYYCARVLDPKGYFYQKYNADTSLGSTWLPPLQQGRAVLPIQEDETGLVLWALGLAYRRYKDWKLLHDLYPSLVRPIAQFLAFYRDPTTGLPLPSYDLWEERYGIFTFTSAAALAGLLMASELAGAFGQKDEAEGYFRAAREIKESMVKYFYSPELGRFIRGIYGQKEGGIQADYTLDASLLYLGFLDLWPEEDLRVRRTIRAVREGLWVRTQVGGLARYTGDYYFRRSEDIYNVPGNPWLVCTLWLAAWLARTAKNLEELAEARALLEWASERATPGGMLPEQIHPYTGEPLSVSPLTWSHASLVTAVEMYLDRWRNLKAGQQ